MKYSKQLLKDKARDKVLAGAKQVYEPVISTLGAKGRNVLLWKTYQTKSIRDGVKIAQEINPKDPFENAGAEIIKQAAQRTVKTAGDGTSVTIGLSYAILYEANKLIRSGVNPMSIIEGLKKGERILVDEIKKLSSPVTTLKDKVEVATISSQSKDLGKLVGETLNKAGVDGVITVEDAVGAETFVEHEEGIQINSGFRVENFITNPDTATATVTKARLLITDYKLNNVHDLVPLFEDVFNKNQQKNIVVIAEDVEGIVLMTLVQNKMTGKLNALAIKAPSYQREQTLRDIAILTGSNFISREAGFDLKKLTIDDLGYADRVTSSREATVIVGGGGDKSAIKDRIKSIKAQIDEEKNEFSRKKLQERLAKITGGIFVIYAGGATEAEIGDKRERLDDSIQATRAAIRSGVVPGGEVVYLRVVDKLKPETEEEEYSYRILKNALELPFIKLVENAGFNAGVYLERVAQKPFGYGVDVQTGEVVDMRSKGIVDPTLVLCEAIRNAVSAASILISSDSTVIEQEDK